MLPAEVIDVWREYRQPDYSLASHIVINYEPFWTNGPGKMAVRTGYWITATETDIRRFRATHKLLGHSIDFERKDASPKVMFHYPKR